MSGIAELDFETYSAAGYPTPKGAQKPGIFAVGAKVYAEHPSTEVLFFAYDLKDGLGWRLWVPEPYFEPTDLFDHIRAGKLIEAHNSSFEYWIWKHCLHERFGWPALPFWQLRDSAAKCRANAWPGALEKAAKVSGAAILKDPRGAKLIQKYSVPQGKELKRLYLKDNLKDAQDFYDYCVTDIKAEEAVSSLCPDLSPAETEVWLCTQAMNERGIALDMPTVNAACTLLDSLLQKFDLELTLLTGGAVSASSETQKMAEWMLVNYGVATKAMDADHVEALLKRTDLPPVVRRVLEIRQLSGSAGVKKLYAMARMVSREGRVHDLFHYHGARTGRDTGQDLQPQNLVKHGPKLRLCTCCGMYHGAHHMGCPRCGMATEVKPPLSWRWEAVDQACEDIRNGEVEKIYGDSALLLSGCIRGLFIPGPGKDFIVSDYSSIEAVVTAVLAGCQWRIDTFKRKECIYTLSASKITGTPLEVYQAYKKEHGTHHIDRSKYGKTYELSCFGPQTQVLTNRGYVGMVDVLLTDKLWDGYEWVTHEGVVHRGEKATISLDGVQITPEHPVNLGNFWTAAEQVGSSPRLLNRALERGLEALQCLSQLRGKEANGVCWSSATAGPRLIGRDSGTSLVPVVLNSARYAGKYCGERGQKRLCGFDGLHQTPKWGTGLVRSLFSDRAKLKGSTEWCPFSATAGPLPTGCRCLPLPKVEALGAILALKRKAGKLLKIFTNTPIQCLTTTTGVDCSIDYPPPYSGATTLKPVTSTHMAGEASKSTKIGEKIGTVFYSMYRHLRDGMTQTLKWTGKIATETTNPETCASYPLPETGKINGKCGNYKTKSTSLQNVFDIVNAGVRNQFVIASDSGHLLVHNCGFGGYVGGYRVFDDSDTFTDDQVKVNIMKWREASPEIPELWGGQVRGKPWAPDRYELFGLEGAAIAAIQNPGTRYTTHGIGYVVENGNLYCILLSGRRLVYHNVKLRPSNRWEGQVAIWFEGWNSNPKMGPIGWIEIQTYAGRLCENLAQATARDIMMFAVPTLERAGYPLVLRVHDELVAEVPEGFGTIEEFELIMGTMPPWAQGWPVRAAGGWRGKRYRKD